MHHGLAHDGTGIKRGGAFGIEIHQVGQQFLIERSPIGTDAHGLVVMNGHFDNGGELPVALFTKADITRIDPVFGKGFGASGMGCEQTMANIMEITDQRNRHIMLEQTLFDMRDGSGGLLAVNGNAHQFRSGTGQRHHLFDGRVNIGRIGIGHGLHDNRRAPAHTNALDINRHALMAGQRPAGWLRGQAGRV